MDLVSIETREESNFINSLMNGENLDTEIGIHEERERGRERMCVRDRM